MRLLRLQLGFFAAATLVAAWLTSPALADSPRAMRARIAPARCTPGAIVGMRSNRLSYAVVALRPLSARRVLGRRSSRPFATRNVNGVVTVFGVLAARVDGSCRLTDFKVQLPIRPNGATGWVRAVDVRLRAVHTRIAVDLSQRRITLFRDGRPVLVTAAVIGAPSTPTPTGRFYVNQRLLAASPIGDYGLGAVGISAFPPCS